jgi:hypothetical protein
MPTKGDQQLTAGFEPRDESRKENSYALDLPCREIRIFRTKRCLTERPSGSVNQKKLVGYKVIYLFIHFFVVHSRSLSVFYVRVEVQSNKYLRNKTNLLTYLLHGAESFLRS